MSDPATRGRQPTAEEEQAIEVARTALTFEKSLSRIESTARLTFGAVAGTAATLSALGLSSAARQQLLEGPMVFGLPASATLLLLSLVLAGAALVPSLRHLNSNSPSDVRRFFEKSIGRRGRFTLASLVVLAAALLFTFVALLRARVEAPQLTVTTVAEGGRLSVDASASVTASSRVARVTLTIRQTGAKTARCRSERMLSGGTVVHLRCRATVAFARGGTVIASVADSAGATRSTSADVVSR